MVANIAVIMLIYNLFIFTFGCIHFRFVCKEVAEKPAKQHPVGAARIPFRGNWTGAGSAADKSPVEKSGHRSKPERDNLYFMLFEKVFHFFF